MHGDKYIIIGGAPRSGTNSMTRVFWKLGLDVGHEMPSTDGVVGWQQLCLGHPLREEALSKAGDRQIIRMMQSRHPVPTINSMIGLYRNRPPWITNRNYPFGMEKNDTPVMKAMRLYFYLNAAWVDDKEIKIRYCIENIGSQWPIIAEAIGIPGTPLPDISRDANTFRREYPYPELQWSEIYDAFPLYGEHIANIAGIMGYDVNEAQC